MYLINNSAVVLHYMWEISLYHRTGIDRHFASSYKTGQKGFSNKQAYEFRLTRKD
jgi:hypothetical protein